MGIHELWAHNKTITNFFPAHFGSLFQIFGKQNEPNFAHFFGDFHLDILHKVPNDLTCKQNSRGIFPTTFSDLRPPFILDFLFPLVGQM